MKSFGSNFHTCNHVHHHGIHVRIHYYYTIKRKNFAQQREKREREEVGRKLARCAIDKRKSGNVGSLSSRHRINPWFTIVQSLFILTLRNDSTRFNPRVPTHYTLPRIYVVALLRILGFVFTFSSRFIISRPTWLPLSTDSVNIEANIDLQIWISI